MKTALRLIFLLIFAHHFSYKIQAQHCKPLSYDEYDQWYDLTNPVISENGNYVMWERNPQKGDGSIIIYRLDNQHYDTIHRAYSASFLAKGTGLVFKIKPPSDSLRRQQLAGIKKEKQLKDSLGVWLFTADTLMKFAQVKSYHLPGNGDLLGIWHEEGYHPNKDSIQDTTSKKKASRKKALKKDVKMSMIEIVNIRNGGVTAFDSISSFSISEEKDKTLMVKQLTDSIDSVQVNRYYKDGQITSVFNGRGKVIQLAMSKFGDQAAFLFSPDTSERKLYQLVYEQEGKSTRTLVDTLSTWLGGKLTVSQHQAVQFSEDGTAIYFGVSLKPEPRKKDSLTEDEKVSLDIWNWKDGRIQSQQLKELEKDQKSSFRAVYYPRKDLVFQLADDSVPELRLELKLHQSKILGFNYLPYQHLSSWEQSRYADVYLIDRERNTRKILLEKHSSLLFLSPEGGFLLYYHQNDSSWYCINTENYERKRLTWNTTDIFYQDDNDVPNEASAYGFAGWKNDNEAIVYSKRHLWLLNLKEGGVAKPLTKDSELDLVYRFIRLDKDAELLPAEMYLSTYNRTTKASGFAKLSLKTGNTRILESGFGWHSGLAKAKEAEVFIFRKESFELYPDLYVTLNEWEKKDKISHTNPQQKDFCWGSVELVSWRSFNGDSLQGLLYYPATFTADSSYPMIVYFYETHSDNLFRHFGPRPSRSTINIADYTSRGYFVFTPDIRYRAPLPGQSSYDAILSGTQSMLERVPQIDQHRMGLQGQSWGGYQTAWLVTRTNLFKAAMAGAPVSNMTSAYGGIRWESGMVRSFQYEEGQSRIGASLWENQQAYIENSPLFYADRVETPLLMMSNDQDGAVPWYQGIEFYNALRRLGKPVWMLVYNNAPHNLIRRADSMDLTMRMQQFFDHYLKGYPMPPWMSKGIPAVRKGKDFGF